MSDLCILKALNTPRTTRKIRTHSCRINSHIRHASKGSKRYDKEVLHYDLERNNADKLHVIQYYLSTT